MKIDNKAVKSFVERWTGKGYESLLALEFIAYTAASPLMPIGCRKGVVVFTEGSSERDGMGGRWAESGQEDVINEFAPSEGVLGDGVGENDGHHIGNTHCVAIDSLSKMGCKDGCCIDIDRNGNWYFLEQWWLLDIDFCRIQSVSICFSTDSAPLW